MNEWRSLTIDQALSKTLDNAYKFLNKTTLACKKVLYPILTRLDEIISTLFFNLVGKIKIENFFKILKSKGTGNTAVSDLIAAIGKLYI